MAAGSAKIADSHMRDAGHVARNGMLSKVPEVTIYFWIIKVLCTTVGETVSDFLNVSLGFGLTGTSIVMGILLLISLFFQFKTKKYVPVTYWLAVVLISVFGTLITDELTDSMGIPLEASTLVFVVALAATFVVWYAKEKTLSIHSIFTKRRELFYWLAILFTFALGTAAGDLMAESLGLGYLVTGIIVCAAIAAITVAWRFRLDPVLAFWIAYILTRPLGASLGDYLSQNQASGGLGFGPTLTSAIFLLAIIGVVVFLTLTRRDVMSAQCSGKDDSDGISVPNPQIPAFEKRPAAVWQVVVVLAVLVFACGSGYYWRCIQLRSRAIADTSPDSPLGDLSSFLKITEDTLELVQSGDLPAAKSRVGDLESAWDEAEARIRPLNKGKWSEVDDAIDDALRKQRSVRPDADACRKSLESLTELLKLTDKTIDSAKTDLRSSDITPENASSTSSH